MIDGTSRRSSSAAPGRPGSRWCSGPMPLKRCVTIVAPGVGRRARTVVSRRCCDRARRRRRGRAATRSPRGPGSASGASVTRRTRSPKRSQRSASHSRSTGRTSSTRVRAGRAAEERPFEVHAEHHVGPRRARPRRAARASARTRRAARVQIVGQARRATARDARRRSCRRSRRRTRGRSRPVPRRSPGCRRSRGRAATSPRSIASAGGGTGTGRHDAAVGHDEPGRRGRGTAFAVAPPPLRLAGNRTRRSSAAARPAPFSLGHRVLGRHGVKHRNSTLADLPGDHPSLTRAPSSMYCGIPPGARSPSNFHHDRRR